MARTSKLTDLQLILLSTAAARDDGNVFTVKDCIAGKTAEVARAITPLLKRGLVVEYPETVLVRVWREDTAGWVGLAITNAGRLLVDAPALDPAPEPASEVMAPPAPPRAGSKIEAVLTLLRRPAGATSAELVEATGWLLHTLRAALTGLRKKGHVIERARDGDVTSYRFVAEG